MRPVRVGGHPDSNENDLSGAEKLARSMMSGLSSGATANVVNRTHRVVRERAQVMHADRNKMRGLMLPLLLSSAMMILLYAASWMVVEQYADLTTDPSFDGHHLFMILLWFLPASAALVTMVWFHRGRNQSDREVKR